MDRNARRSPVRRVLTLVAALLLAAIAPHAGGSGAETLAEVELLSSSAFLSAGSIYVVGEVQNTGTSNVSLVRAVATFRDAGNALVGTAYSFVLHDILAPGQISPFLIEREMPAGYASYDLALDWAPSLTGPMPQLSLSQTRLYVDRLGFPTWVGEVTNTSGFVVSLPEIQLTLYDELGEVRNVEHAALFHDVLAPGQRGAFQVVIFNGPQDYASLRLTTDCRLSTTAPPNLRSLGVQQTVGPGGGPRFTGQIRNLGSSRVSRVRAVVTLYDGSGAVVNASYAWTDPINLEAGEQAPFDLAFSEAYQGWTSYRLDPPSQAPTATPTASRTRTPTVTPTETMTPTPTETIAVTATATATVTLPHWRNHLPLILRGGAR